MPDLTVENLLKALEELKQICTSRGLRVCIQEPRYILPPPQKGFHWELKGEVFEETHNKKEIE
jgi:hypothetical protein